MNGPEGWWFDPPSIQLVDDRFYLPSHSQSLKPDRSVSESADLLFHHVLVYGL